MSPDPTHPLVPVIRRVLERRGIVRFYDESRIEIETVKDALDTDAGVDEMTVLIYVTLDTTGGGTGEVYRFGPITCCGQASVSEAQWLRDWTGALTRLLKNAAERSARTQIGQELALRRVGVGR